MNSKECLEKLYDACDKDLLYEQYGLLDAYELFEIIKQDLDRLEKLEKENSELLIKNEKLDTRIVALEELNNINRKINDLTTKAVDENTKLKKVIEILKRNYLAVGENRNSDTGYIVSIESDITQKEYELLMEVLENA